MDDYTFQQLKESGYHHPDITDVIVDSNIMMEMAFDSFSIAEKGYDTMWDSTVFDFAWDNFKGGMDFLHKHIAEKGIKLRLITDVSKENIDKINSLVGPE